MQKTSTFSLPVDVFLYGLVYKIINSTLGQMSTTIAINQLTSLANRPEVNFKTIQQTIARNAAEGSLLSIFPEDFLYGVLRGSSELMNAGMQFDRWVKRFRDQALQYQIDIIPGTLPRVIDGRVYNSTVYIDRTGAVLTTYSKNNLWLSEREEYAPSLRLPKVFDSVLGKTAIVICWDMFDHSLFKSAVKQGAEWIIVLAFWSTNQSKDMALTRGAVGNHYTNFSDSKMLDILIQARVSEYNVGIIFCNFAGKHFYQGLTGPQTAVSANRSQVVTPYLNVLYRLSNRKEATLLCKLDNISQSIRDFETHYGRRSDTVSSYPWLSHQP
jgi:predicted amidohydrolase